MNKTDLRQATIASLKEMDKKRKQWIEMKLFQQLTEHDSWQRAMTVGITVSQGIEWDTKWIIETAWNQGKMVCVPKCYPKDKQLTFHRLETWDQLEIGYTDLLEPNPAKTIPVHKTKIELLIVPGLIFNKQGSRIGFGGGYYDRFLRDFSNETISLASEDQIMEQLPVEPFDISVHQILTENGPMRKEF